MATIVEILRLRDVNTGVMRFAGKIVIVLVGWLVPFLSYSQITINEVSQGPAGSQEYVEFLVTGTGCVGGCLDLRLWIFDDNNGYLNGGVNNSDVGIAPGAYRFADDVFWSCIPNGTLITIYNDGDPNPDILLLGDDVSMVDGNCNLVIPINSALFDHHTTEPNTSSSAYPVSGWVAGGSTWSRIAMKNKVDGFQIYNPADLTTPVFSIGWGQYNGTQNDLGDIYMGTGWATDDVFYVNVDCDMNWAEGCAGDIGACVGNFQTPGAPNNASNAACISALNNGCVPVVGLTLTVTDTTGPLCFGDCTGSATIQATNGTGSYAYSWDDPSNQATAIATGLCAGTFNPTVTDLGDGCTATVEVVITAPTPLTSPTQGGATVCTCSCSGYAYVFPAGGTPNYTVSWDNGYNDQFQINLCDGTYNVNVTDANGCISTGVVTIP